MTSFQIKHDVAMRYPIEPGVDLLFEDFALLWYRLEICEGELSLVSDSHEVVCMETVEAKPKPHLTLDSIDETLKREGDTLVPYPEEEDLRPELEIRWSEQLEEIGLDSLFNVRAYDPLGWLTWGLLNGVLPEQPFLVWVSAPHYYKSSWEYDEWDFDVDYEIVGRLPPNSSVRDVEQLLDSAAQDARAHAESLALTRTAQRLDVDRMFISVKRYYATRGWDDTAWPDGVEYSLFTTRISHDSRQHGWGYPLVSGRSDKDNHEEAMQELREAVARELPHVTERLDSLPRRHQ
jgi:hypothetical protein